MALGSLFQYFLLFMCSSLIYFAILVVKFFWNLHKVRKAVDQFPMDSKHWFWGHLDRLSDPGEGGLSYYKHMVEHYPKACGLYMGNFIRPYVVVHHPETVRAVLTTIGKKPIVFGIYKYGKEWLGEGLIMSHGQKWFRNRRLLTMPFYFENLKYYNGLNNEATKLYLNNLAVYAKNGETFEIYKLSSMLTLDIILRCMFSYDSGVQLQGEDNFYLKAVEEITRLWVKRYYEPLKHYDFIHRLTSDGRAFKRNLEVVNGLSGKMIKERKLSIEKNQSDETLKPDFLDILLKSKDEDGNGLSEQEIKDEVNTFIFGGHDTTASTIAWTLYSLAGNPQWQKICQDEVDQMFKDRCDENVTWDDLHNLTQLTKCVKEAIRLHGVVPFIERELDQDLVIDGKKVPNGTSIMLLLYNLHHNPTIWNEPMKFDPERFSDENVKKMDSFAYRPFSAGPRSCIAQNFAVDEVKVVLAKVLRRFTFTREESMVPSKIMVIAMRSTNGVMLKVSARQSKPLSN